jgi:hypothetical protein
MHRLLGKKGTATDSARLVSGGDLQWRPDILAYRATLDSLTADRRARRRGPILLAAGMVLLGALWIGGHALSLMPSLALSNAPAVSPAATVSAQAPTSGQAPSAGASLVTAQMTAQSVPAAPVAQNTPTETPTATTGGASAAALPVAAEAVAEDTDGTPLPQRRFLIEARADPIFGAEPDQPLASAQEPDSGTTASGTTGTGATTTGTATTGTAAIGTTENRTTAQAAAPDQPRVKRARAAPPPRRHVTRTRAGPRSHVSRQPPSLRKALRQINPLRGGLRVGGLRVL